MRTDSSVPNQGIEIDNLLPVPIAEKNNRQRLMPLSGVYERQKLKKLVERSEPAREHNYCLCQVGEPILTHEEVMKVKPKIASYKWVVEPLGRDRDCQADIHAASIGGTLVGGLHDAGAATGAHHEAPMAGVERLRPCSQSAGQLARLLVIGGPIQHALCRIGIVASIGGTYFFLRLQSRLYARRTHENDGVLNAMPIKATLRLEGLRQDSQHAGIFAVQERLIPVRFNGTSGA